MVPTQDLVPYVALLSCGCDCASHIICISQAISTTSSYPHFIFKFFAQPPAFPFPSNFQLSSFLLFYQRPTMNANFHSILVNWELLIISVDLFITPEFCNRSKLKNLNLEEFLK